MQIRFSARGKTEKAKNGLAFNFSYIQILSFQPKFLGNGSQNFTETVRPSQYSGNLARNGHTACMLNETDSHLNLSKHFKK
jgi:hypothetical protein